VGAGGDETLTLAKLTGASGGTGASLANAGTLGALKDVVAGSGGFFTLRSMASLFLPAMAVADSNSEAAEMMRAVSELLHQGADPITFSTIAAPGPLPSTVTATMQIPRGAIEDLVGAGLKYGAF
jgi:hypothetical protein